MKFFFWTLLFSAPSSISEGINKADMYTCYACDAKFWFYLQYFDWCNKYDHSRKMRVYSVFLNGVPLLFSVVFKRVYVVIKEFLPGCSVYFPSQMCLNIRGVFFLDSLHSLQLSRTLHPFAVPSYAPLMTPCLSRVLMHICFPAPTWWTPEEEGVASSVVGFNSECPSPCGAAIQGLRIGLLSECRSF